MATPLTKQELQEGLDRFSRRLTFKFGIMILAVTVLSLLATYYLAK
jgi:hypothetical protein